MKHVRFFIFFLHRQVGDSVPVEVTRTVSLATVLWQDGQIETDVACTFLIPGKFGSIMKDFYPGNFFLICPFPFHEVHK